MLRRCRVQGARTFGVHANAQFEIEGCTIGRCGLAGALGGGIFARAGCVQLRQANGVNENRVQRDQWDEGYSGYSDACKGCVGKCTCTALYALARMSAGGDGGLLRWDQAGRGRWQNAGCL